MVKPHRYHERPKLLIDVSEKVSEDLRIITHLAPAMPQSLQGPKASKGPKSLASLSTLSPASLGTLRATTARRTRTVVAHKPPPALARKIAARISRMLPDDGEVIFAIAHWGDFSVGQAWCNECDWMFWIAAEHQVLQAVYEWMNSEYEAISDTFGYDDTEPIKLENGHKVYPSIEALYEAWDYVANDQPLTSIVVDVENLDGVPVDSITMTAAELMSHLGICRDDLIPFLVIADSVTPADHAALYGGDDIEVYLDEGYVVTDITSGDEYVCVHINPK